MTDERQHVLVTTSRGVFAGELVADRGDTVVLANSRCAVYWSEDVRGFLGLASKGPSKGCRITGSVPSQTVYGVTTIVEMTAEAVKAWESEPWES